MCGIVGFVDWGDVTSDPARVLAAMSQSLIHRGPDQEGVFTEGPVHLAHRRLAIVDPTPAGRQPFVTVDTVAMANGELYNHQALRLRLASDPPIPRSDCAILPALYAQCGENLASELSGMFALAVWDRKQRRLVLARDPAGQKPLYVADLPGGGLAFASEVRALLQHPALSRDLDWNAFRSFLAYDFVPGARTIYRGVRRLRPGETLVWQDGKLRASFAHEILFEPSVIRGLDEGAEAVWATLKAATERRLMADVPLGVFLSGGLDSAAVVAALAALGRAHEFKTFSVAFDAPSFDESTHAQTVADTFGTEHHVLRVRLAEVREQVPALLADLDEPFADPSYIPTRLLSAFAAAHVKVVLGGDGGDELFLGYPTFVAESWVPWARRLPRFARERALPALLGLLPGSSGYMPVAFKGRRFLSALDLTPARRHVTWIGGLDFRRHAEALTPAILDATSDAAVMEDVDAIAAAFRKTYPGGARLDALAMQYLGTYLADGVLTKVDRASMAHGLEVRSPFLDRAMMRLAGGLPSVLKLKGRTTKRVLRHALRSHVPKTITRRKKQGFALPIAQWLRGGLKGWMMETLDPVEIRRAGIFNPQWVEGLIAEHLAGRRSWHKEIWALLAFESWRRGAYGPGGGP